MEILEMIFQYAILPIIATIVIYVITNKLKINAEDRKKKNEIFERLISSKHHVYDFDRLRVINLIPIVFSNNSEIVSLHKDYIAEFKKNNVDTISTNIIYDKLLTKIGREIKYYSSTEHYNNSTEYAPKWVQGMEQEVFDRQSINANQSGRIVTLERLQIELYKVVYNHKDDFNVSVYELLFTTYNDNTIKLAVEELSNIKLVAGEQVIVDQLKSVYGIK